MGNLLSYSGLTTKIRAMQSKLLTDTEYKELAELSSVPQAVAYLKQKPSYSHILNSLDDQRLHRGDIEKLLINSVYNDFARIYRFANTSQRGFLTLYFKRYEIAIMKDCLNNIFDHREVALDLSLFKTFFDRHSKLDINTLAESSSIEEFVNNLKGSEYYRPLIAISHIGNPSLFDYELALDLYYFRVFWKVKDKMLSKTDLAQITHAFGNKFDLLNIQWIYRARNFYKMSTPSIYALTIPTVYKLKKSDITALVEAEGKESFQTALDKTYYGKRYEDLSAGSLEEMYSYIMKNILSREVTKNPYSVAILYRYLYLKDHEIQRLTVTLECIRYGLTADDALTHIFKF